MKRILLALVSCTAMQAAIITLSNGEIGAGSGSQASRVWNLGFGGGTMTVTAFSVSGGVVEAGAATTTQFGSETIGLGVCSTGESCGFNAWQVDNNQGSGTHQDFVLFAFSIPVNVVQVRTRQTTIVGDSDAAWATGGAATTIATMLSGLTIDNAGNWTNPSLTFLAGNNRYVATTGANNVRQMIFGTPSTDTDDLFKLYSIEVVAGGEPGQQSAIPEPGSLALLGGGLLGLGVIARRRRKQ